MTGLEDTVRSASNRTSRYERRRRRGSSTKGGIYIIGGPEDSNKRPGSLNYDIEPQERTRFDTLRPAPPRRIIFPFCSSWEGKELQELMMGGMFGDEVGESHSERVRSMRTVDLVLTMPRCAFVRGCTA